MAKELGGMTPRELRRRLKDMDEVAEFEAFQQIVADAERQAWEDARAEPQDVDTP